VTTYWLNDIRGFPPDPRRYLVLDVEWRKRDECAYVVHELTKSGALHKGRYSTWLSPSNRVSIEYCDEPLPDETRWRAESARRASAALLEAVLEKGELSMLLPKPPAPLPSVERRYRSGRASCNRETACACRESRIKYRYQISDRARSWR